MLANSVYLSVAYIIVCAVLVILVYINQQQLARTKKRINTHASKT